MTTLKWFASAILVSVMIPALYSEAHCPRDVASIRPRFIEHSILVLPVTLNHSGPFDFVGTRHRVASETAGPDRSDGRGLFYARLIHPAGFAAGWCIRK